MRRLAKVALLAWVVGTTSSCRPAGVVDTALAFEGTQLSVNNLGYHSVTGSDTEEDPILRFQSVGLTGSAASSPNTVFDLVVRNKTFYEAHNYNFNKVAGQFGSINVKGPPTAETLTATFEFCAVEAGKPNDETMTLDIFPLSFYDLCAPPSRSVSWMQAYMTSYGGFFRAQEFRRTVSQGQGGHCAIRI